MISLEAVGDVPIDQASAHAELARALHQVVELVVEPLEGTGDGLGPLLEAADVLGVEVVVDQLQELLVLDVPGLLIGDELGQDLGVHLRAQDLLVVGGVLRMLVTMLHTMRPLRLS